jgi:hypothetical protein
MSFRVFAVALQKHMIVRPSKARVLTAAIKSLATVEAEPFQPQRQDQLSG